MMSAGTVMENDRNRLLEVVVEAGERQLSGDARRECHKAIEELIVDNQFEVIGRDNGPYRLVIANAGTRLAFHISDRMGSSVTSHFMSIRSLLRIMVDYHTICDAHLKAVSRADPYRIEAIDMGRRAIHTEGSAFLQERLSSRVILDLPTARRLFTLITAMVVGMSGEFLDVER